MGGRGRRSRSKKSKAKHAASDVKRGQFVVDGQVMHWVDIPVDSDGEEDVAGKVLEILRKANEPQPSTSATSGTQPQPGASSAASSNTDASTSGSNQETGSKETVLQIFARKGSAPAMDFGEFAQRTAIIEDLKDKGIFYFGDWIEWQNLPTDGQLRAAWSSEKLAKREVPAGDLVGDSFWPPFFPEGVTLTKKECEDIWGKDWFKKKTLEIMYCQWHNEMCGHGEMFKRLYPEYY